MASKNTLSPRLQREKLAFRYSTALEAGDFEALAAVLEIAVQDQTLAEMLREIDEVYARELDQGFRPAVLPLAAKSSSRRPIYWLALAAAVALVVLGVINLRSPENKKGVSSEYLTATAASPATLTQTPAPSATPTLTPTVSPTVMRSATPSPEPTITRTPAATPNTPHPGFPLPAITIPTIVIPALDIQIPEISVPGVVIPTFEIHVPEIVVTVDLNPWDAQP